MEFIVGGGYHSGELVVRVGHAKVVVRGATRVCCLRRLYEVVMKVGFQSVAMIVVNGGRKGSSLKIKRRESCELVYYI